MSIRVTPATLAMLQPWRERYRREMNCQVIHDSLHRREGWTISWQLDVGAQVAGYGSMAQAGPWRDRPTVFEFYVLPEHRALQAALFAALLDASGATSIETQTNNPWLTPLLRTSCARVTVEKILFRDGGGTTLPSRGATMRRLTPVAEARTRFAQRDGGSEWELEFEGRVVGRGGVLFHYNPPYGDVYMEIDEPWRRRGLGAWLIQELKRECCDLGGIPAARCDPDNDASRETSQRAGFIPCGELISGFITRRTGG